jgi:hypothetical protein
MPPIEGGQSLAEAKPIPKRGSIFMADFYRFPDDYSRTGIDFRSGPDDNSGMGKLNFDLEGNELPRPEGYRKLGGMVRPLAKGAPVKLPPIELDQEPAKIFERSAEPPVEVKVVKSGRGRPKKEGKRPWEEAGMSKSTWYEKKSKGEV